jgi:protein-S-isoprenylcysteine O-methyltransferase Ste14
MDDLNQLAEAAYQHELEDRRAHAVRARVVGSLNQMGYAAHGTNVTRAARRKGKRNQVIGGVIIALGVLLAVGAVVLKAASQSNPDVDPGVWVAILIGAGVIIVFGWAWYCVGRFTEWWNDY